MIKLMAPFMDYFAFVYDLQLGFEEIIEKYVTWNNNEWLLISFVLRFMGISLFWIKF